MLVCFFVFQKGIIILDSKYVYAYLKEEIKHKKNSQGTLPLVRQKLTVKYPFCVKFSFSDCLFLTLLGKTGTGAALNPWLPRVCASVIMCLSKLVYTTRHDFKDG